jgi:hypothetical protein
MPRFVLLFHQPPPDSGRASHWDLMFEHGDVLRTWALTQLPRDWQTAYDGTLQACGQCPPLAPGNTVEAEELADHRLAYLSYEGPISGDRGTVTRVAAGTYDAKNKTADRWAITVAGLGLCGRVTLQRTQPRDIRWQMTVQPETAGD